MLERRRSVFRRALSGGVMLALLACLPLLTFELIYVFAVCQPQLGGGETAAFVASLFGLLMGTAALLGALEGLLVAAVALLAERLAVKRVAQPRWLAAIYTLLAAPLCSYFVAQGFAGRRAQLLPARHVIAVLAGALALSAVYILARLVIGARDRFRLRRWGKRHAVLLALVAVGVATGLYWADQRVLRNLYGFFHVALALATVLVLQLAVAALHAGWRPTSRWIGRLLEPQVATLLLVAAVAGYAFALDRVGRSELLRFVVHEHTAVGGKLADVARRMRLLRKRGAEATSEQTTSSRPVRRALKQGPRHRGADLLLITIDALRPDHLGSYGYRRRTSPAMDALAKRSVVFERAYCATPHTSFSMSSMMTGRTSLAGGAHGVTLAAALRQRGYRTAAFFPPAVFYIDGERFRGFRQRRYDFQYVKYEFLAADKRVDQVERYLATRRGPEPVFLWVHFFEPHEPYQAHPKFSFGARSIDRYDSEIAFVDAQVERLLAAFRRRRRPAVVALTSDHGEAFGEHDSHYHGSTLYEEQIRVPLFIAAPKLPARRVDGPAQLADLAPTLLRLLDVSSPANMDGRDLGPWLVGEDPAKLPAAFVELEQRRALVGRRFKLIDDAKRGFAQLYDLRRDPGERQNLVGRHPERLRAMRRQLLERLAQRRGAAQPSAEALLRAGRGGDVGAAPGLARLARRGDQQQRRDALELLLALRVRAGRAVFEGALDAKDPPQRLVARIGAAYWGHADSLKALPKILARADLPPALRRAALLAQARTGRGGSAPALVRSLEAAGGEIDVYGRIEVIEALGKLPGSPRPEVIPALLRQLRDLRCRPAAIRALGQLRAREAVPKLMALLRGTHFVVWRVEAARALGRIGDPAARPLLQQIASKGQEASVVAAALPALAALGGLPVPETSIISGEARCEPGKVLLVLVRGRCGGWSLRCGEDAVAAGLLSVQAAKVARPKALAPAGGVTDALDGFALSLNHRGPLRFVPGKGCELIHAALRPDTINRALRITPKPSRSR